MSGEKYKHSFFSWERVLWNGEHNPEKYLDKFLINTSLQGDLLIALAKRQSLENHALASEYEANASAHYAALRTESAEHRSALRKFFTGNYDSIDEARTVH